MEGSASEARSASAEWRAHWQLVIAAMAGSSFSALAAASIGLFMEPLGRDFGWGRAQISTGLTIYALIAVPLSPIAGALIDRWGARRVALPGVLLTAAAFAGFSLADGSSAQWLFLWLAYSLVGVAVKGTVWTTAVAQHFSAGRGLALACTLSGSAVTMTVGPVLTQVLIAQVGWRQAYVCLGAGWGLFVLCLLVPFFFDARMPGAKSRGVTIPASADGLTLREALSSHSYLRIAGATLLTVLIVSAVSIHMVPLLTARGLSRELAALCAGASGIASIGGKLATGWMLDRWRAGWVGALSLALPSLSYAILLSSWLAAPSAFLAITLIGYANGAFLQISTYMTSRYVGMRHFGKIYGVLASLTAAGLGLGPVLAGWVFDRTGSYGLLLSAGIALSLLSGLLLTGMPPFPDWTRPQRSGASTT